MFVENVDHGIVPGYSISGLTEAKMRAYLRPLTRVPEPGKDMWPTYVDDADDEGHPTGERCLAYMADVWTCDEACPNDYHEFVQGIKLLARYGWRDNIRSITVPTAMLVPASRAKELGELLAQKFPSLECVTLDMVGITSETAAQLLAPLRKLRVLHIEDVPWGAMNWVLGERGPTPLEVVRARADELESVGLVGPATPIVQLLKTTKFV